MAVSVAALILVAIPLAYQGLLPLQDQLRQHLYEQLCHLQNLAHLWLLRIQPPLPYRQPYFQRQRPSEQLGNKPKLPRLLQKLPKQ